MHAAGNGEWHQALAAQVILPKHMGCGSMDQRTQAYCLLGTFPAEMWDGRTAALPEPEYQKKPALKTAFCQGFNEELLTEPVCWVDQATLDFIIFMSTCLDNWMKSKKTIKVTSTEIQARKT